MKSPAAQDLEKHLAQQVEELLGRFFPIAQLVISDGDIALAVLNVGCAMISSALTNLAIRAKPGHESLVVSAALSIVRAQMDLHPGLALEHAREERRSGAAK